MGAYENPQQIVDTQSGDAWVSAINSISNAANKASSEVTDYLIEKKKKNEVIEGKVAEDKSKLEDYIYGVQGDKKAGGADYATMYKPALDEYSKLNLGILKKTSANPALDREKMSKIRGSIYSLKGLIEGTIDVNERIGEARDKQGSGSLDLVTSDPDSLIMHNIMRKEYPGTFTPAFLDQEPGSFNEPGFKFTYKDPVTGEEVTKPMSAKAYSDALEKGSTAGIVVRPDIGKSWDELQNSSIGIYKKDQDGKNTSMIEDKYITSKIAETTTKETANGKYVTTEFFVDKDSMLAGEIGTKLKATAAGIFTANDKDAQSIYNNDMAAIMGNKDVPESLRLEKLSDDFVKGKKMATQSEMDNQDSDYNKFLRNYAKLQLITKVPNKQVVDNPDYVANAKALPINKNKSKLTPNQVLTQNNNKADNEALEDNISVIMQRGGILPGMKEWSYKTGDKMWRLDGIIVGTNPAESNRVFRNAVTLKKK